VDFQIFLAFAALFAVVYSVPVGWGPRIAIVGWAPAITRDVRAASLGLDSWGSSLTRVGLGKSIDARWNSVPLNLGWGWGLKG